MKEHQELITNAEGIRRLVEGLRGKDMVAFDTEFIRESTFFPVLEIIQVATDEESWLVDVQAFRTSKRLEDLEPLMAVFQDPGVLKILHAAQGDQECLYTSLHRVAKPTLDTAVAASLLGYGDSIGLGNLLSAALDIKIKKGHARTNWSVRPLAPRQIEYAHADVIYLVELARFLLEKLDAQDRRPWALELTAKWEDPSLYESDPDTLFANMARGGKVDPKGLPVLRELIRWREARIRELNIPRKWMADDGVLMDLARARPTDLEHLRSFRGLNKGEIRNQGEKIIAAIKRGMEAEPIRLERTQRQAPPSSEESRVLDLLKCFLGMMADRHGIALRHLVVVNQLLPLIRSRPETVADLTGPHLLSPWAASLVGEELLAVLQGKRAFSIEKSAVKVVRL